MNKFTLAAAALALCAVSGSSAAGESLQARAFNALGVAIAVQGDAALVQIRKELKQSALEAFKPFLPQPAPQQNQQPAATPVAQR